LPQRRAATIPGEVVSTQHSGLPPILPQTAADDWQEYLARRGLGRPPHPPFLYSNFGFGLLGQLLAARAGLTIPNS